MRRSGTTSRPFTGRGAREWIFTALVAKRSGRMGRPRRAIAPPPSLADIDIFKYYGTWTCNSSAVPEYGPDGKATDFGAISCFPRANIANPIGPFSGYDLTDFTGALVGMFVSDT